MSLTPDFSLVVQIATFLILWAVLKRLVFDPMQHVLEVREQRTAGTKAEATATTERAQLLRDQCEQAVLETRTKIAQEAEAARRAAQEEQARILEGAREEASKEMERLRASLTEQVARARAALSSEARSIAFEMVDQVTRRPH
jgi:F-type H+-transporting ATPase subunit b